MLSSLKKSSTLTWHRSGFSFFFCCFSIQERGVGIEEGEIVDSEPIDDGRDEDSNDDEVDNNNEEVDNRSVSRPIRSKIELEVFC